MDGSIQKRAQWEHSREHRKWGAQCEEHMDESTSGRTLGALKGAAWSITGPGTMQRRRVVKSRKAVYQVDNIRVTRA